MTYYSEDHGSKVALFLAVTEYGGACQCCGESRREFLRVYQVIDVEGDEQWFEVTSSRKHGGESLRSLRKKNWPRANETSLFCLNCGGSRERDGLCPHEHEKLVAAMRDKERHG